MTMKHNITFLKLTEKAPRTARLILGYMISIPLFILVLPGLVVYGGEWIDGVTGLHTILPYPYNLIPAVSVGFMGLFYLIWSLYYLVYVGRGHPFSQPQFGVHPRPEKLVVEGPYRRTRNPMAFGAQMYALAVVLWFNTPGGLLVTWPLYFFFHALLIRYSEEPGLKKIFGYEYRLYLESTNRFFPRLKRLPGLNTARRR